MSILQTTKPEAKPQAMRIETVKFYDDGLLAVVDAAGVWVSLRRCCDCLGVSMEGQLKKLKDKPWGCVKEMFMQVEGDYQQRNHVLINLRSLAGWLFSIDARKVLPSCREKLIRYQQEAADVLADHFFGCRPRAAATIDGIARDRLVQVLRHLDGCRNVLSDVLKADPLRTGDLPASGTPLNDLPVTAPASSMPRGSRDEKLALDEYCQEMGIESGHGLNLERSWRLRRFCCDRGYHGTRKPGSSKRYPRWILDAFFAQE